MGDGEFRSALHHQCASDVFSYIVYTFSCIDKTDAVSLQGEADTLRVTDPFSRAWLPVHVSGR